MKYSTVSSIDLPSVEKAFSLFSLSKDANEEELKQAYHKLSTQHHPDKQGDDNSIQSKINEAHDIAVEYIEMKKARLPMRVENALIHVDHALAHQQALLRASEAAARLRNKKTYNLNKLKYLMWVVGATSGVVALFSNTLIPVIAVEGSEYVQTVKLLSTILTFMLGVSGFFLQWKVTYIQNSIDAYIENLSDKKTCASFLAETLNYNDDHVVDETRITHLNQHGDRYSTITSPFTHFSVPHSELSPVLLQKSLEHGLLEEIEEGELSPDTVTQYNVAFKPSLFKPTAIPKQEPKPMTLREAKSMLTISIIFLLLFGSGAIWLGLVKKSMWALLPGLLSLGAVGMALDAITSLRKA